MLICQVGRERMGVTGGSQMAYVMVEARPNATAVAPARVPLNVALVIDHSGSMKGAKLKAVKDAVKLVIDQLDPTDIVSVTVLDDNVKVVVPAQPATNKPSLTALVDGIRDGGGTSMSLGMNVGLTELRKFATPNMVNRMILLTDGVTYGDADRCSAHRGRRGCGRHRHPSLGHRRGLGRGSARQRRSAQQRRAREEFIRRPDDALGIFARQLQSAEAVAVKNVQLTVRLPAGVTPKKSVKVLPLISEQPQDALSDRETVVLLGDLERDTPQAVLLEILVEPKPAGTFRIAQAELRYDVPGHRTEVSGKRRRHFHHRDGASDEVNPVVLNYVEKANAHRLVTRVLDEFKKTGKVTTRLHPNVTRILDPQTQRLLDEAAAGGTLSAEDVKDIGNKTRKLSQRMA